MGLSPSDVKELTTAYWKNMEAMQKGIVARGGFEWHSFVGAEWGKRFEFVSAARQVCCPRS